MSDPDLQAEATANRNEADIALDLAADRDDPATTNYHVVRAAVFALLAIEARLADIEDALEYRA